MPIINETIIYADDSGTTTIKVTLEYSETCKFETIETSSYLTYVPIPLPKNRLRKILVHIIRKLLFSEPKDEIGR
jgi:hypothetical protein